MWFKHGKRIGADKVLSERHAVDRAFSQPDCEFRSDHTSSRDHQGLRHLPDAPNYTVSLVDLTGKTVRTAMAANRSWSDIHFTNDGYGHPISLPQLSASDDRLYYLDGDATVRYLAVDGASGVAHALPSEPLSHAAFAVSPDDQRIAVTVVDYPSISTGSAHMRLYVEDLSGATHHVELFDSTTVVEWPIGWHAAELILGVGGGPYGQNPCGLCAYTPDEYHVADPTTGKRLATICPTSAGGFSAGLATPAGIECELTFGGAQHQSLIEAWDGSSHRVPTDVCGVRGPLSPDGSQIATTSLPQQPDGGCTGGGTISLIDQSGKRSATAITGAPEGWIDSNHLVIQTPQGQIAIFDISGSGVTPAAATGTMVEVLPGGLG